MSHVAFDEDFIASMNKSKELVVERLVADGLLDGEKAAEWAAQHAFIAYKQGWLGCLVDKVLFKADHVDKNMHFKIVKLF